MQFHFGDDHALLQQTARDFFENEASIETSRPWMDESAEGFSRDLYGRIGSLGYFGLAAPEAEGGAGLGRLGLAIALHEAGRVALPGPFLDVVVAAEALRRAAGDEAREWFGRVIGGEAIVVCARRESTAPVETAAPAARFREGRVTGTKLFVPFGDSADALLATTAEGLALVPKPSGGWGAKRLEVVDHAQRFAEIALDAPGTLVADTATSRALLEEADRLGSLGAAAFLLGLMERALEITVAYTTGRKAFGVPIAAFQTLQHRMADMLVRTEASRAAVYRAAWASDVEPDTAPLLVATAKAYAGDAARFVCGEAIQLHGGVGYTWEYDPHILFKRVKTLEEFHGRTRDELERVLAAAGI